MGGKINFQLVALKLKRQIMSKQQPKVMPK